MSKIQWAGLIGMVTIIVAALILMSVNQPTEEEQMQERVKLAKICTDGGGVYSHNSWNGYICEFDD